MGRYEENETIKIGTPTMTITLLFQSKKLILLSFQSILFLIVNQSDNIIDSMKIITAHVPLYVENLCYNCK